MKVRQMLMSGVCAPMAIMAVCASLAQAQTLPSSLTPVSGSSPSKQKIALPGQSSSSDGVLGGSAVVAPPQNFYSPPQNEQVAPQNIQNQVQQNTGPTIASQGGGVTLNGANGNSQAGMVNGTPSPGMHGIDFSAAASSALPMTPSEILTYRQMLKNVNQAQTQPLGSPPASVSRSIVMSLSATQNTPEVDLQSGNVTTLTFADNTGAPWPIASVVVGDKDAYQVMYDKSQVGSNILVLDPLQQYANLNNMAVILRGSTVPLIFGLRTGGTKLDNRIDVNVAAAGPNANPIATPTSPLTPTNDTLMQEFVDGVPPSGAVQLTTSSPAIQAWSYKGAYYLRTSSQLFGLNTGLGSVDIANSVDGNHVYRLSPTPTVTMSNNGALSIVTISDSVAP